MAFHHNTTLRHNPEELDMNLHRRENLKSQFTSRKEYKKSVIIISTIK
jgi:hypothetical protein